jgi:hypothetical protein
MNEVSEKTLGRIRNLLKLAQGECTNGEHERTAAMEAALTLLAKYNLEMADVTPEKQEGRIHGDVEGRNYTWIRGIANAVARLYFCEVFTVKTGKDRSRFTYIGLKSNVSAAQDIVAYLIKSVTAEASASTRKAGADQTYKWSFMKGAAYQIGIRARCMRAEAETKSASAPTETGLVLASVYEREKQANDNYIKEQLKVELVTSRGRTYNNDARGQAAGRIFGNAVGLQRQLN